MDILTVTHTHTAGEWTREREWETAVGTEKPCMLHTKQKHTHKLQYTSVHMDWKSEFASTSEQITNSVCEKKWTYIYNINIYIYVYILQKK